MTMESKDDHLLEWSDNEDDDHTSNENYWKVRGVPVAPRRPDPNFEATELKHVYYDNNVADYKRSRGFHGHVIANPKKKLQGLLDHEKIIEPDWGFSIPFPYIPSHVAEAVGRDALYTLWDEFIRHDADITELVMRNKLNSIAKSVIERGFDLPFHALKFDHMDKTDYVDYKDVAKQLANHMIKNPVAIANTDTIRHRCCTLWACQVHGRSIDDDAKEHLAKGDNHDDNFCLDVIYKRMKLDHRGRLKIKHVIDIMDFANIKYDKTLLPDMYWSLKSEHLVEDANQLQELIETLSVDKVIDDDDETDPNFKLPKWLRDEFKASEKLLFKHQFKLIDVDGGGSIDVDELMMLCESLGTRITLAEANAMMEAYDVDKSGSIDFYELMMLMFKVKHGTIDLESNALANAMVEAKTQIRVFEEIEEIGRNPPDCCSIYSYGGSPVKCDYLIIPPKETIYFGSKFLFRVVFLPGYPFKIPDTFLFNRIFHPNFVTQLDGRCEVPHMNDMWNATWDTRQLLIHIVSLFKQPDLSLVPDPMVFAAKAWSWLREDERRTLKKAEEAETNAAEAEKKADADDEKERMNNALNALRGQTEESHNDDKKESKSDVKDEKITNTIDSSNFTKDEPKENKNKSDTKGEKDDNKNDDDLDGKSVHTFVSNAESEEWDEDEVFLKALLNESIVAEEKVLSARSNNSNNNKSEKGDSSDTTKSDDKKDDDKPPATIDDAIKNDDDEEDEHDRDSGIYLGAGDLEGIINKLSRQEQMHVNVIALFVDSLKTYCGDGPKNKYFEVVKYYMEKYAHEYEEPEEPIPEAELEPVVEEVKEEYTGFWDDDDDENENSDDDDDGLGTQDYNNDSSTAYSPDGNGPLTQMFEPSVSIESIPKNIVDKEPSQVSLL